MVKEIKLDKGKVTIVDDEDYAELSKYKWHVSSRGYVCRFTKTRGKGKMHLMHRMIMNTSLGKVTDHINGDKLDNRKENLRITTDLQNSWNQGKRGGTSSKYKGVSWITSKKKWRACIKKEYKAIHLGYFDNEHDAARMYNFWAVDLFGEYARLNVIKEENNV